MPPTSDETQQHEVSGCLFLLLWVGIVLGLVGLAGFAFMYYLVESIGS